MTGVTLADLDGDGTVESIAHGSVVDQAGNLLWSAADATLFWSVTTAADLDGDGDLEVILGRSAYDHLGNQLFLRDEITPGLPQVGDVDGDGLPEIVVVNEEGFTVIEHDGTIKPGTLNSNPTGEFASSAWSRPAALVHFDGDGNADLLVSSRNHYAAYRLHPVVEAIFDVTVSDESGAAGGTAFDFLGDGGPEAVYGDEEQMFAFDAAGQVLMMTSRWSATYIEYPSVADVDNDGSAEIVIPSNLYGGFGPETPTVQVIRDEQDRWIPARRIWNQHSYHVTNVREDGTIPPVEPRHWEQLNTFRVQAQISSEGICEPAG